MNIYIYKNVFKKIMYILILQIGIDDHVSWVTNIRSLDHK